MGHNPSRYKLKALSADAQHAVDEYKARSVWSAWWSLNEKWRRRYFTKDERTFITRYGARLDELACQSVDSYGNLVSKDAWNLHELSRVPENLTSTSMHQPCGRSGSSSCDFGAERG